MKRLCPLDIDIRYGISKLTRPLDPAIETLEYADPISTDISPPKPLRPLTADTSSLSHPHPLFLVTLFMPHVCKLTQHIFSVGIRTTKLLGWSKTILICRLSDGGFDTRDRQLQTDAQHNGHRPACSPRPVLKDLYWLHFADRDLQQPGLHLWRPYYYQIIIWAAQPQAMNTATSERINQPGPLSWSVMLILEWSDSSV